MKRFYKVLAFALMLALLAALSVPAFAAGNGPSAEDIAATGDDKKIAAPDEASYLSDYVYKYVSCKKLFSLYGYSEPREGMQRPRAVVFHGSRVRVLAEQNGYSCIQYHTACQVLVTAWIPSSFLVDEYPGRVVELGTPSGSLRQEISSAVWSWGRWPGTGGRYLYFEEPVENCTGFTLDYQVISVADKVDDAKIFGTRTIYVYNGEKWVSVGSFPYKELGPVHVVVALDEPMTVMAARAVATCEEPDKFADRQDVLDIYTK